MIFSGGSRTYPVAMRYSVATKVNLFGSCTKSKLQIRLAHRNCGSPIFDRSLGDYFDICNVMMNLLLGLETPSCVIF